jgi:cell volume regulation protein A
MTQEPHATTVVLLTVGVLLLLSVLASRLSTRAGLPVVLFFLALGMLAGKEGLGGIAFDDFALSYRIGTFALVLILFDGGLRTSLAVVRRALAPAALLATAGVVITGVLVAAFARLLGFGWAEGLLLGAIVASTDVAAVFSILRGGGVHLSERVGSLLELESGLNDPMAVLLTFALSQMLVHHRAPAATLALLVAAQLAIGVVVGAALGVVARTLLARVTLRTSGVYPLFTTALALVAYGVASFAYGSGFLAAYVAGVALGNGSLPYKSPLLHVHDFVAWTCQVSMFLVLGLLVSPSALVTVAASACAIALWLAFVARPVAASLCMLPFGYSVRETALVGWIGLRGAVPIVLAVVPILEGAEGAQRIFNVVFFVVIVSALLQGGSARWLTQRLGLGALETETPEAIVEIASSRPLEEDVLSFRVHEAAAVCGARIADIPFPEHSSAMLVVRGAALVAPKGDTLLEAGDHVYVFCRREDVATFRLLFGKAEEP